MDSPKVEKLKKLIQKRKENINQLKEKLKEEQVRLKKDQERLREYEFSEFFKVVSSNGITPQEAIEAIRKELNNNNELQEQKIENIHIKREDNQHE